MSNFLPEGYKTPQSNSGYTKFPEGTTRIRILSKPILFWEDWLDKKPIRYKLEEKPVGVVHNQFGLLHCWAMKIYNYDTERMEVCQISQLTIKSAIEKLASDEEWGDPFTYDIKINKSVKGDKVTYTVVPCPKKPVQNSVQVAYKATNINLSKLLEGESPFSDDVETAEADYEVDQTPQIKPVPPQGSQKKKPLTVNDFLDEQGIEKEEDKEERPDDYPF